MSKFMKVMVVILSLVAVAWLFIASDGFWPSVFLTLFSSSIASFISWKTQQEKLGGHRWFLIILFIVTALASVNTLKQQRRQNTDLKSDVSLLNRKVQDLLDGNKTLSSNLIGVREVCDTSMNQLRCIARTIAKIELKPKSINLTDSTSKPRDDYHEIEPRLGELVQALGSPNKSGNAQTGESTFTYTFRSRNIIPIRDLTVDIYFSKAVEKPRAGLHGAIVIEQGTRDGMVGPNHYRYQTGYLSQSNDLVITMTLPSGATIDSISTSP